MNAKRVLIVCADPGERAEIASVLASAGYDARLAETLREVLRGGTADTHAVVLDREAYLAGDADGSVEELAGAHADVPFLVTTHDAGDVADAVELMRRGAFTVIPLPVDGPRLAVQIEQALRHRDLALRNAELQRSLDVHERLAMIGKLAAGVAHELNNPLDGVLRFVNLASSSLPGDAPQQPFLHEAKRGLRRMADIVRDLLQFSRNASIEIADEDGERLARDAVAQMIAQAADRRIETSFEFPGGGIALPRAMFQVIANVAKNAIDAMPSGGKLRVAARIEDGRLRLRVSDTGAGIPEEIRERVFEPFFTTKEVGRGTGLGLPICQRIVERLGGHLAISSEPGMGTTVEVDLPLRRRLGTTPPHAFARGDHHVALTPSARE